MTICEPDRDASFLQRTINADSPGPKVAVKHVAWIIFSGFAEHSGTNFQDRIVPAAETFLSAASGVYVVVGATDTSRKKLHEAGCTVSKNGADITEMECKTRGATLSVLLTPCGDAGHTGDYDKSTCCKYDKALSYLGDGQQLQGKDWVYLADDDMYVQTDAVLQFLAGYDASMPLIVNADGDESGPKVRYWNRALNECNDLVPQAFFYTLISKGLMERLLPSAHQGGTSVLCSTTGGSYDTTVGLWAWRHGAKFIPAWRYSHQCLGDGATCTESDLPKATLFNHGMQRPSDFALWHERLAAAGASFNCSAPQVAGRDYQGATDTCAPLFKTS